MCFCCSFIPFRVFLLGCKNLKMEPGCFCFCFIPTRVFSLGGKNLKMEHATLFSFFLSVFLVAVLDLRTTVVQGWCHIIYTN